MKLKKEISAGTHFMPTCWIDGYEFNTVPRFTAAPLDVGSLCMLIDPIVGHQSPKTRFLHRETVYTFDTKDLFTLESRGNSLFMAFSELGSPLTNKRICLTGEFRIGRPALEEIVKVQGGELDTKVHKNTSLLVTEEPNRKSGKLARARTLGIPIIGEDDFFATAKVYLFSDFFTENR